MRTVSACAQGGECALRREASRLACALALEIKAVVVLSLTHSCTWTLTTPLAHLALAPHAYTLHVWVYVAQGSASYVSAFVSQSATIRVASSRFAAAAPPFKPRM